MGGIKAMQFGYVIGFLLGGTGFILNFIKRKKAEFELVLAFIGGMTIGMTAIFCTYDNASKGYPCTEILIAKDTVHIHRDTLYLTNSDGTFTVIYHNNHTKIKKYEE